MNNLEQLLKKNREIEDSARKFIELKEKLLENIKTRLIKIVQELDHDENVNCETSIEDLLANLDRYCIVQKENKIQSRKFIKKYLKN